MITKGSFSTSYHLRLVILYIYQDGTTASRFKGHESSFKNANILYMYEYAEMLQSESYTPSYVEELQMDCNLLQRLNDYLVVVCDNLAYIHMI